MDAVDDILVLEDEALIALDIEMTLERAGVGPVSVVPDRRAALAWLEARAPRAALLDFNLGRGETSIDVAYRLQALDRPFAFLTGYTSATVAFPPDLDHAARLSKPFDEDLLVTTVQGFLPA